MNFTLANKNPFLTFDFLGYFFPGAFVVGLFFILTNGFAVGLEYMPPSFLYLKQLIYEYFGVGIFLLVIISYIIGHIVSYVSSVTVELFFTWCYGYPTYYLMGNTKSDGVFATNVEGRKGKKVFLLHFFVCILLFPLLFGYCIFERLFGLDIVIGRKLDSQMRKRLSELFCKTREKLGFDIEDSTTENKDTDNILDIHRVVMHLAYEKYVQHQVKFDNYVALYGFLRSITFVFNCAFIYLVIIFVYRRIHILEFNLVCLMISLVPSILYTILHYKWGDHDKPKMEIIATNIVLFGLSVFVEIIYGSNCFGAKTVAEVVQLVLFYIATYTCYLGFAKFYRRFTLENFMAHLVCTPKDNESEQESANTPVNISIKSTSLLGKLFNF